MAAESALVMEKLQRTLQSLLWHPDVQTERTAAHVIASRLEDPYAQAHENSRNLSFCQALLQRCQQLDEEIKRQEHSSSSSKKTVDHSHHVHVSPTTLASLLLSKCRESGYTPLHQAVGDRNLAQILLLQTYMHMPSSSSSLSTNLSSSQSKTSSLSFLLAPPESPPTGDNAHNNNNNNNLVSLSYQVATALDSEGLTISALLGALQRSELSKCRQDLYARVTTSHSHPLTTTRRPRSNSQFSHPDHDDADENEDEQDELEYLSRRLHSLPEISDNVSTTTEENQPNDLPAPEPTSTASSTPITYGCEVVTFGRAHHCAMGVVASQTSADYYHGGEEPDITKSKKKQQHHPVVHPHRIHAFAQEVVGRVGGAVGLAGATHHSLVVTASGHVFATGLGTTGRLGLGDESHSSSFCRVQGLLQKQHVVQVAAAENHSLCVTATGSVFGWGSNRFGQLGVTNTSNNGCLPRRVEDLKLVHCIQVAAGEKHSVALTNQGQVYVWGDNTAGQLGMPRRTGVHKVQRVEALWNRNQGQSGAHHSPKVGIAICASEQTTLVLCEPSGVGLPVNSIYSWGHGNHVPSKVPLEAAAASSSSSLSSGNTSHRQQRPINPVVMACARYHSVAITSDGHVYTWGLHADSLGTTTKNPSSSSGSSSGHKKTKSTPIAAPQLVTGMLPENGGGVAVAVSASENHTAVVTDTGALFTWGDTYKKNVLGHAGVRWQPDPKRVPGVHRAVGVAAAKEHTILLIGASFPAIPSPPTHASCTLESLAARTAAQHVDLFNAIPILIMAERTQNAFLMEYCTDFIRRNLDGVLNVAKKSVLDCYLNEQLVGCVLNGNKYRDDSGRHPLVSDIVLAGNLGRPSFDRETLCPVKDWMDACQVLLDTPLVSKTIEMLDSSKTRTATMLTKSEQELLLVKKRSRSLSFSDSFSSMLTPEARKRADSFCSDRCIELTSKMNIWSKELAEAKLACFSKELRGVRKRLDQIDKLESTINHASSLLRPEEQLKISRRPQLEADLLIFEPAFRVVEKRLKEILLDEKLIVVDEKKDSMEAIVKKDIVILEEPSSSSSATVRFRCDICHVTCPDKTSYELHMTGRKHRNRLSQVADEEEKNKTVSMIEERQRQILLGSAEGASRKTAPKPSSPWQGEQKRSTQPKFKLPPPPHPLPDTVASPTSSNVKTASSKGLRGIMEEESRKPKSAHADTKSKSRPLAVTLPSPVSKSLKEIMEDESRKAAKSTTSKSRKSVPLQLPPGSAPAMKSPPWATPVARANAASVMLSSPSPTSALSNPYSLSDFIPLPKQKATPSLRAGWASPKAVVKKSPSVEVASRVSLRDIQQQEQDFNGKQEQAHDPNTKWFVERRERAGSFKEIQNESVKQREDRLFIEEQIQIEKQILQEVAAAKKANEKPKAKPRPNKPKKQKPKTSTPGKKIECEKKEATEKVKPQPKRKSPISKNPK
jgi:alpha-tubulin suppressor-like RCC1 family protein